VKQLNQILVKYHSHFTVLSHLHDSRKRLLSHWTASVSYLLLTFPRLNLSLYNPLYVSPLVPEYTLIDLTFTHDHEPSINDASKPNKQIYQNDQQQLIDCLKIVPWFTYLFETSWMNGNLCNILMSNVHERMRRWLCHECFMHFRQ
jgi:hypothetical protein